MSGKSQNFLVPSLTPKLKVLPILAKNLLRNKNSTFLVVHHFTKNKSLSQIFCSWLSLETSFCFQVTPGLFKLIFLTILVTLRFFTQFQPKINDTKLQKSSKVYVPWSLIFRSFHRGPNLELQDFQVWSSTLF